MTSKEYYQIRDNDLFLVSGSYQAGRLTGLITCLNEDFFIRAFLDHHRALGVEQFVFFDDQSSDGTREFLATQPDCVVFGSSHRFGDIFTISRDGHISPPTRFGTVVRNFLAEKLKIDAWVFVADVDEFLHLPPGTASVQDWIADLTDWGFDAMRASLVEFFPERIWPVSAKPAVSSLAQLLADYPYFDAVPLIRKRVSERHAFTEDTTTRRLNKTYRVREPFPGVFPTRRFQRWLVNPHAGSPSMKTPLFHYWPGRRMNRKHPAEITMPRDIFLAMMHFKYTDDLDRRAALAHALKSYDKKSVAYQSYSRCLDAMRSHRTGSFLGPHSVRFETVEQFIACDLMRIVDPADAQEAGSPPAAGRTLAPTGSR